MCGENTEGGGCHAGTAQNFTVAMPEEAEAAMAGGTAGFAPVRTAGLCVHSGCVWSRKMRGSETSFHPPTC